MPHDTFASFETITANENLLVLVANPGEESALSGGLIAQSCRRGRPPFVMVLADGSGGAPAEEADLVAAERERRTRTAAQHLGLPEGRLLMAGLFDVQVPAQGAAFDAVVRAVTLVMWARDCNVICAPAPDGSAPHHPETAAIAAAVASGSGVGLLHHGGALRLDIAAQLHAKRAAMAVHGADAAELPPWEGFEALRRPR